ncbi:putative disease resistance protein RGA1 isoform X4 [Quercus robur]|nr:putative disease resistance protein RGA1 isoform X3 [Quercus robur]XP_050284426.1 putative disease resistance protein RGA1 isoform X3 [Quercus robur]XP_050284428.1 putative disease resistance protein RGA1 isoform X3 [Quercus robur]XP_050284429.1 putative disease resistance protein RGA1 isoform X3 [Quercus robur]XP_050284430.1 putative disease resistance protein RGA1 isoform X3 [Quercus robur]XP_050284431.1 putative disease resistance protein RGA1 isoform X3 [Quercus robur]XP_050284432.1 pu
MAEGVLFDIAKEIIGKAGDLALKEVALIWGVKDEINKLKETVSKISAVILDAEAKQHGSEVIKEWLKRLKDAMCDADDLLDEISTEALRREVMTRDKKAREVRIFFSKYNQLAYGVRMGHKVKEMRERLVALDAEPAERQFHLEIQVRNESRRQTHSLVSAEDVIGREEDKKDIIGSLLDPNVKENVSVLAIVGIGGLGKTTLAQLVFNDEKVKNHFELKLWVCVSENFDVKIIVQKILECVKNEKPKDLEKNMLVNNLQKEINGKRYMLVLDDVWNEDHEKWSELKQILMGGAQGSRILVTTRSVKVAKISRTSQPHVLQGLEEQHAWSLFKKMAFEEGEEPKEASFVNIGKDILKICVGVPLAIRTIGGLLYFKKSEREWLSFKDNELSKIPQNEDDILPTLKLSYNHLPSHLKQCFAYCSLFPKDYEIEKESLIYMWMAQGFIKLYNEKQCPEDVGHEYFMDLLWRSFFQDVEEDELGNISKFKMHDLMHDMAIQVIGSESTTIYSKEKVIDEKIRHASFGDMLYSSLEIPISLFKASKIRTFLLPCQQSYVASNLDSSTYSAIVASFKFIRLLDLHKTGIKTIPSSIKNLKHLRYLDLSGNRDIEMLPNSIVKLYNLQTLKLSLCSKLKELPRDINKLVNLRFLDLSGNRDIEMLPNSIVKLYNLQTLKLSLCSKLKELPRDINKLVNLRFLDLYGNRDIEMLPNSIVKLYNLQTLKLSLCSKLKELPRDINKLVNLRFLEIDECSGLTHMPNGLGQLTNLQTLTRFVTSKGRIDSVPRSNGGLKELNRLNELRGNLSIENLKHGKDAALEYKDANLKEKQRLDSLYLNWVEEDIDEAGAGDDDMSLEALQPHINLKALSLERYGGVRFPHWFLSLRNLVQFKLYSCKKCQYLPPLDQLPSLKIIHLYRLDCLEHISDSERDNSDSLFYPSLETLHIWYCPNLKGWWRGRRDSLPSFPRLSDLDIRDCPQLTSFPLFPYLESLNLVNCSLKQSLERMMINNKTSSGNLPSIASSSSSSTIVAPLSKLSFMSIGNTEEALPEECLRNLISLRTLYLDKCPLPQGIRYLTALQHLHVWNSEAVDLSNDWDEMEWQGLTTLLSLEFRRLPKLVSLPTGLQYVSSLQNLEIKFCPSLIAIPEWICKLISLQSLLIWDCPNLESLPEGIGALTSLQTLEIGGCPILLKRCKKQIGEDWHKISRIPNLEGDLSTQEEEPDEEEPNEEISDEEEPNEEAKKPSLKNWDLIKAFGCCNCSKTQQLTN